MNVAEEEFWRAFGRLEGKIDALVKALPDYEARIRNLERWKWTVVGAAGVVSFAVTMFGKLVLSALHG